MPRQACRGEGGQIYPNFWLFGARFIPRTCIFYLFFNRSSVQQQKIPPPPPKRSGSTLTNNIQQDELKVYEVEDTPVQLSGNTSFSDLTVDELQNSGRLSVHLDDGLNQQHDEETTKQRL